MSFLVDCFIVKLFHGLWVLSRGQAPQIKLALFWKKAGKAKWRGKIKNMPSTEATIMQNIHCLIGITSAPLFVPFVAWVIPEQFKVQDWNLGGLDFLHTFLVASPLYVPKT